MHMSTEELSSVGKLSSRTVGAPGTHGAGVLGMQGIGVRTPRAAAVAAATIGFARAAVGERPEPRTTPAVNNARDSANFRFHFPLA